MYPSLPGELGNDRTFSDKSEADHSDVISAIHAALDDPECARILNNISLLREGCLLPRRDLEHASSH